MTTTNDVTGDSIKTKSNSKKYRDNWDQIFKKEKELHPYLYRFFVDCGRMGHLEGLFIAHPKELEEAYGHTLYFGEVLGKHSEVIVDFDEEDIELVSKDVSKVKWLQDLLGDTVSGFNPIAKHNDQKEDGVYDE